jgi:hypothetical protein
MAKINNYRFCFGPWNFSEGSDPSSPTTRPPQTFDWKLAKLKELGFDAMMFHDDDAVPDIDGKSDQQIRKEAKQLKKKLDGKKLFLANLAQDHPARTNLAKAHPETWKGCSRFAKIGSRRSTNRSKICDE